jgi:uncharacterized protein (DUF983 family)
MQPNQERCSACGAPLASGSNDVTAADVARLSAFFVIALVGIVVVGVAAMWLLLTLL